MTYHKLTNQHIFDIVDVHHLTSQLTRTVSPWVSDRAVQSWLCWFKGRYRPVDLRIQLSLTQQQWFWRLKKLHHLILASPPTYLFNSQSNPATYLYHNFRWILSPDRFCAGSPGIQLKVMTRNSLCTSLAANQRVRQHLQLGFPAE